MPSERWARRSTVSMARPWWSSPIAVSTPVGTWSRVLQALHPRPTSVHLVPWGEPTVDSVDDAARLVRDAGDAIVIGVGGGSALDIAKQAAVVSAGDISVEAYLLCATPLPGRRPIVAIPTTSGTGAEVTRTCIVADGSGRKSWTWGDEMLPDIVVLDPAAAATMPHSVTVGTGLDAFVHAIEACSGQRRNSIAAAAAQRAMALVLTHLPRVAEDGNDLVSRQAMQEAAFLAGVAIDNCGTGVAHSIGHALGSLYHVPHGLSVAVGLRAALEWNVTGEPDAYADAADALVCRVDEVAGRLRHAVPVERDGDGDRAVLDVGHVGRGGRRHHARDREPADARQQRARGRREAIVGCWPNAPSTCGIVSRS